MTYLFKSFPITLSLLVLFAAAQSNAVPLDPPNWRAKAQAEVVVQITNVSNACVVTGKIAQIRDQKKGAKLAATKKVSFSVNCRQSKTPPEGPRSLFIGDLKKAKYLHAFLFKGKPGGPFVTHYGTSNAKAWILASPTLPAKK